MLYHDHGITDVPKFFQRIDKAQIITLMQTDTRLVENIQHIHQLRTDLSGQTDTLAFSSGQTNGTTV